jgi:hypothetical protein
MIACAIGMTGIEQWLAGFGQSDDARMMLGRIGLAVPYATAGAVGMIFLFAAAGATNIKTAGWSVVGRQHSVGDPCSQAGARWRGCRPSPSACRRDSRCSPISTRRH